MSRYREAEVFPIRVYLRDTVTGFTHAYEAEGYPDDDGSFNDFIWCDGNFSCDCNRWLFITEHGTIGPPELRDMTYTRTQLWDGQEVEEQGVQCDSMRIMIDKIERADTGEVVYTETEHP